MAYKTKILPYEILIRWKNGTVSGIHAQDLICVYDGKELISEQVGKVRPVEADEIGEIYAAADALADLSRLQSDFEKAKADWGRERGEMLAALKAAKGARGV